MYLKQTMFLGYIVLQLLYIYNLCYMQCYFPRWMFCTLTLLLLEVCVQHQIWLLYVVPWFRAFPVCCAGTVRITVIVILLLLVVVIGPPGWGFDVPQATALCINLPAENTQRLLSRPKPTRVAVPIEEEVQIRFRLKSPCSRKTSMWCSVRSRFSKQ